MILAKYAEKNEDGTVKRNEGDVNSFTLVEDKKEEWQKALEDFGKNEIEVTMEWRPLTPDALSDIRLSAAELELLGDFFTDQEGPGVPQTNGLRSV